MRFKKLASALVSTVMCLSMFAVNVTAEEADLGLTPVGGQFEETVDVSQLVDSGSSNVTNHDYAIVSLDTIEPESDEDEEPDDFEGFSLDGFIDNGDLASTNATANPLSSLTITGIGVGNTGYDPFGNAEWYKSKSFSSSNVSYSVDATGYSYICVEVLQWGYTTSVNTSLDGASAIYTREVYSLNSSGKKASTGDTIYGFVNDYIFEIPDGKASSTITITGYHKQSPAVSKTVTANITWTTPTGPAPTTPAITYLSGDSNYALVTGVSTSMEYSVNDNDNWSSFTGTEVLVPIMDEEYTFKIRYKTSTNGNPSLNCELLVKTYSAAPAECAEYYSSLEILVVYESDRQLEISLSDSGAFFSISANNYSIESVIDSIQGEMDHIYLRYAATADEPASGSLIFVLYPRNTETPDDVYYSNGVIYNLTSDMMFRFNGGNWYETSYSAINVTSFMSTTETTLFEIRYKATDTASCSATIEITLPALSE